VESFEVGTPLLSLVAQKIYLQMVGSPKSMTSIEQSREAEYSPKQDLIYPTQLE